MGAGKLPVLQSIRANYLPCASRAQLCIFLIDLRFVTLNGVKRLVMWQ